MKNLTVSCSIILALASVPAFADVIAADGTWHEFAFGVAGTFATSCGGGCVATVDPVAESLSSPPWTFSGPGIVSLTDLFQRGDQFALFDHASLVGDTSVPVNDAAIACPTAGLGNDILDCLADPSYSHGSFTLGGGAHSLTIEVIQNALNTSGGAAAFRVATAVPEPSSVVFLGSVLVAVGALRLKKGRKK